MSMKVKLPAPLAAFLKESDLKIKSEILTQYSRQSDPQIPVLIQVLQREIKSSDSKTWQNYCQKFLFWAEYQQFLKTFRFEPSSFLKFLNSSHPLDHKAGVIQKGLPQITSNHTDLINWFEKNVHSKESSLRNVCRRTLDYLGKKGHWQEKAGEVTQDRFLEFKKFMSLEREESLKWLENVEKNPSEFTLFMEWSLTALLLSQNPFVTSKLLKVVPKYFLQYQFDYSRLLGYICGFTRHEDDRVRANALEGLSVLMKHKELSVEILKLLQEGLKDSSPRVKAIAAILLHPLEPDETSRRVGGIIAEVESLEALEGLEWSLSGSNFGDLHAEQIKRIRAKLQKVTERDYVGETWQG
jgi:hypothetical protein